MPGWIIAAAITSVAVTAVLTFVLWRVNAPQLDQRKQSGDGGPIVPASDGGGRDDSVNGGDGGK